jgi:uncharacterized protein YecE (DUF72 family)
MNSNQYVGTMGWSYSFWKGPFYPKNTIAKDFLTYYANQFRTVEVDSTFYRIPSSQIVDEWKNQTPSDFLFSLKFPQRITHYNMLRNCEEDTEFFLEKANLLGPKLGVLLLQFPPMFKQIHYQLLKDYVKQLPQKYRYAIELRNKSLLNKNVYSLLKEYNIALVWVDSPDLPFIDEITADFIYLRWEGDRKKVLGTKAITEINQLARLQEWATKLKSFMEKQTLFFGYFSKYYSGYPPKDVIDFINLTKF